MDKLIIDGRKSLAGTVSVSGAKNSALPLMAATLLSKGVSIIGNVPKLRDIGTFSRIMRYMGCGVKFSDHQLIIDSSRIIVPEAPYDMVKTMRASVLVLGPLLVRSKRVRVSLPGGCSIGARPINLHLSALSRMGADIIIEHGYVKASTKDLSGAEIYFDIPTVTGTENLMMAAVLAKGRTVLDNAAKEPEIIELAEVLNKMGGKVSGAGTERITITGVQELKPFSHNVMPDRIEAGTFMIAAAATGGNLLLRNCPIDQLEALRLKLQETGSEIRIEKDGVRVIGGSSVKNTDITTSPYPGFPTDLQAQFMSLMSIAEGTSIITESIFENRFMHVSELRRMGADIKTEGKTAVVTGVRSLSGAEVMATDLRASASLIIAALVANGRTEISRIYHLERGYEEIDKKLSATGATIERVKA